MPPIRRTPHWRRGRTRAVLAGAPNGSAPHIRRLIMITGRRRQCLPVAVTRRHAKYLCSERRAATATRGHGANRGSCTNKIAQNHVLRIRHNRRRQVLAIVKELADLRDTDDFVGGDLGRNFGPRSQPEFPSARALEIAPRGDGLAFTQGLLVERLRPTPRFGTRFCGSLLSCRPRWRASCATQSHLRVLAWLDFRSRVEARANKLRLDCPRGLSFDPRI